MEPGAAEFAGFHLGGLITFCRYREMVPTSTDTFTPQVEELAAELDVPRPTSTDWEEYLEVVCQALIDRGASVTAELVRMGHVLMQFSVMRLVPWDEATRAEVDDMLNHARSAIDAQAESLDVRAECQPFMEPGGSDPDAFLELGAVIVARVLSRGVGSVAGRAPA